MTDLIACPNEHCGRTTTEDDLRECAGSVAHLVILHCPECEADCGMCQDEAAREWRAEHG